MSLEFDEEKKFNNEYDKLTPNAKQGLTNWLIKIGAAKDENGAKNIMIVVSIICFALAIYFAIK